VSGELSLLSDGGLLLDLPDLWLEPLLLFEVPLCAELGRKVNRLGCNPADVMQRSKSWVQLAYITPKYVHKAVRYPLRTESTSAI
jgi:hypothetical protein